MLFLSFTIMKNVNKKLTRILIRQRFQTKLKMNQKEANNLLESILEHIKNAFLKTHDSSIKISSFGTFRITEKKERMGRNPRTLEDRVILPRKKITFRAAKHILEILNRTT